MSDNENLPARMLTCAARLEQLTGDKAPYEPVEMDARVALDAVELLKAGAYALPVPAPCAAAARREGLDEDRVVEPARLVDPGPGASRKSGNACPVCGSYAGKKLFRSGSTWMTGCPACGSSWTTQSEKAGL